MGVEALWFDSRKSSRHDSKKLANTDIHLVKQDVLPYIENERELDIWSNDYFLQLADMIVFK